MPADRDGGVAVVGEHPLPVGLRPELGHLGGRLERERELAVATGARARRARRPGEPEAPEELAPRPPLVAGAGGDERLERVPAGGAAAGEVADVGVGLPGGERLGLALADRADVAEADPDRPGLDACSGRRSG